MSVTITTDQTTPLMNIVSGIEERQCNLIGRHRNLRDKIATMERSIPALMAYNMWMTERDCPDAPYCKVREMMNMFSPSYPDPADRLVAELRNTVNDLHQETTQLHDKIVDADVKLEETDMELESLELANKEMEERLIGLRNDIQRHSASSLHSIHSEDLICLKKIHQFAEEELKLKNCIKQLESKEIMYRQQMNKLLSCKKYQCDNKQMKLATSGKEPVARSCPLNDRKCDLFAEIKEKYPLKDKGRATCEKLRPLHSCCVPLDSRTPQATAKKQPIADYRLCCGTCRDIPSATFRLKSSCSTSIPCESLLSVASETGLIQPPVPCDFGKTCKECKEIPAACKQIDNCICACKLFIPSCDYNIIPSKPSKKTYQPSPAPKLLRLGPEANDSNSDDEFCECCSCDYGDNERDFITEI